MGSQTRFGAKALSNASNRSTVGYNGSPDAQVHKAKANMEAKVQLVELKNSGDVRGFSFTAPPESLAFVGRMSDVHLASTLPGAVRGNHYHLRRREAIVVLPGAQWSFHWDEDENAGAQHREFDGSGAVLILISPG